MHNPRFRDFAILGHQIACAIGMLVGIPCSERKGAGTPVVLVWRCTAYVALECQPPIVVDIVGEKLAFAPIYIDGV